jgi:hypothetical protein
MANPKSIVQSRVAAPLFTQVHDTCTQQTNRRGTNGNSRQSLPFQSSHSQETRSTRWRCWTSAVNTGALPTRTCVWTLSHTKKTRESNESLSSILRAKGRGYITDDTAQILVLSVCAAIEGSKRWAKRTRDRTATGRVWQFSMTSSRTSTGPKG